MKPRETMLSSYQPVRASDPLRHYEYRAADLAAAGWTAPGWYFWDETWSVLHGPYLDQQEAQEALLAYARRL